jgi:hypothetical protein
MQHGVAYHSSPLNRQFQLFVRPLQKMWQPLNDLYPCLQKIRRFLLRKDFAVTVNDKFDTPIFNSDLTEMCEGAPPLGINISSLVAFVPNLNVLCSPPKFKCSTMQ